MNPALEIGLNAAIVAIRDGDPAILSLPNNMEREADALPYGRFDPTTHRTMEMGLRDLAEAQTGVRPGYVEQLYTFGDRGRHRIPGDTGAHVVSVGYLALARLIGGGVSAPQEADFRSWYDYFPWEDWRKNRPIILDQVTIPALCKWAESNVSSPSNTGILDARSRVDIAFGLEDRDWMDELVLERYELLYAAGLVQESVADGRVKKSVGANIMGEAMQHDHRRILATAIARLRSKLRYRPVIFELMAESFTLTDLQRTVESIAGRSVHKQNFRRLVETAELVEPTGQWERSTGGRPAALYRFRSAVLKERPGPGLRVGRG